ncbi:MAG: RNA 2',3'-cyclic phosphodiesterase [Synergistetes bacterium]|nr:RNA 2',3'-cyclic phosphodiesterase [Synergistota bacterium]MCX8127861.1 RNA 2',3'-cyclic phosphodiesterase [Synergistota bacterium]MDW8192123.1 RNA 2',3'-cyclic phosphodiesterase [Synergistota bacterium]
MNRKEIIRSFVCIELPKNIRSSIQDFINESKDLDKGVKWVEEKNLHVTIKFLGEEPVTKVEKIKKVLSEEIAGLKLSPFELCLKSIGAFPNFDRPRVIWVGLEGNGINQLTILRDFIEARARKLDFPKDEKAFSPHITIGRVKTGRISSELKAYLEKKVDISFGAFFVHEIVLMRSQLFPSGPVYTPLAIFALEGG